MPPFSSRRIAGAVAIAAGLAATAAAQDCRLSLSSSDWVLTPGETAQIHAWAEFPPTAYAFASADFDIAADMPGWSFASSGAVAGDSVLGATASQIHNPPLILADPTNPKRIWTGTFAPDSYEPRLVPIEATPGDFQVYPSDLTASPAPCPAAPGRTWVLVNPDRIGQVIWAGAEGTAIEATWSRAHRGGVNVLMGDGSVKFIKASVGPVPICCLLPAIQKVRAAAARLDIDGSPDTLSIEAEISGGEDAPRPRASLNFTKIEFEYKPQAQVDTATGYLYRLIRDGRIVGEYSSADGSAPFILGRLPNEHETRLGDEPILDVHMVMSYDEPTTATIPGTPGVLVDQVEVVASCKNNLKQLGLAAHNYTSSHKTLPVQMSVIVDVTCRVDINGDGALDFFDFLAFQNLMAAGDALADFSGDGILDFFDFLQFQNEFAAGCP